MGILSDPVVVGARLPAVGEEDHANRLAEVVERETGAAYPG